jgi:branched-chain amino acid transport system substrate-binding protein
MRPTERSAQETAVQYAVESLGAENLGLLYVNTEYGANAVPVQRDMAEELGATVVAERDYAPDANDLTEQVLAMQDADAVVNWAFPNPLGVQLNQFVQNGIDIPTVDAAAAGITVNSDLASGEAIENLYGVTDCNPADDERQEVRDWAAEYESRFDEVADFASAGAYDAVHLVAAAAEQAGATDPASVREGLLEIEFTDGVCAPIYQADAANTLHHQATVVGYAGGEPTTEEVFEIDMAE